MFKIALLLMFTNVATASEKVRIIFYPQIHKCNHPTNQQLREGIESQLTGLLQLAKLVHEKPDLPIFAEDSTADENGIMLRDPDFDEETRLELNRLTSDKILSFSTVEDLDDYLTHREKIAIWQSGFAWALNAIKVNENQKTLNLIPTTISYDSVEVKTISAIQDRRKRIDELAEQQTDNRVLLVSTAMASGYFLHRLMPKFPGALCLGAIVGSVDFMSGRAEIHKLKESTNFNPEYEEKLWRYLAITYREDFVLKQMTNYIKRHRNVREVFLVFGSGHQFQEIQKSSLFEFENPPKITERLVQYDEVADGYDDFLTQVKSKL